MPKIKMVAGLLLISALLLTMLPASVFAQEGEGSPSIQDLLVNGDFEGGFQDGFGVGYGWGAFSNGNAVVGWNFDDWAGVVTNGNYSQRMEIKDALDQDRYAGIYQTVSVVPGQQYKLTVNGLVRSDEGDVLLSDYGYRLQYAVDYNGDTAWELVDSAAWQEIPWDEQPTSLPTGETYQTDTYDTTITATGDQLTIFIRGWKKWINNGAGVFNVDEVSFVGPAPDGFQSPVAQAAAVSNVTDNSAAEAVADTSAEMSEAGETEMAVAETDPTSEEIVVETTQAEVVDQTTQESIQESNSDPETAFEPQQSTETTATQADTPDAAPEQQPSVAMPVLAQTNAVPQADVAPLPVSGQGSDDTVNLVVIIGVLLLMVLVGSAVAATVRKHSEI